MSKSMVAQGSAGSGACQSGPARGLTGRRPAGIIRLPVFRAFAIRTPVFRRPRWAPCFLENSLAERQVRREADADQRDPRRPQPCVPVASSHRAQGSPHRDEPRGGRNRPPPGRLAPGPPRAPPDRRAARTRGFRSRLRTARKGVRPATSREAGDTALREAASLLDRAARKRIIPPNKAAPATTSASPLTATRTLAAG